jgi:hypothetical protein
MFSPALTTPYTVNVGVQVIVDDTAGVVTLTRASGDWTAGGSGVGITATEIGRWVRITNLTVNTNKTAKILSVSALVLTVTHTDMVDETDASGCDVTVLADLTAGTTAWPIAIERAYTDLSNTFAHYPGMLPNTMQIQGSPNTIMTGSFGFLGQKELSVTSTIGTSYTPSYGTVTQVLNGIDHMEGWFEGGVAGQLFSFSLSLQNNLRERLAMGTLGAISIGTGQIGITGECVVYFASGTLANKYLNFTNTNVVWKFRDGSGNRTIIDIPRIRYTSGPRGAGGINTDVMLRLGFTGFLNPTQLQSMRMAFHDGP